MLRLVAVAGVAGVGFHAWAAQRMMCGWRNSLWPTSQHSDCYVTIH